MGKNTALIIAGGKGTRMELDIPKQFIEVYGKPVIIYTMEVFQNNPEIDAIVVVCLDGWQERLCTYAKKYGISKLESIVVGGESGQDSIRNGINDLARRYSCEDDIVPLCVRLDVSEAQKFLW